MSLKESLSKVSELERIRGFSDETIEDKIECFKEESQEFLNALSGIGNIAEEGADVINVVLMIFKRCGIDPDTALNDKYEKDKTRVNYVSI